MEKISLDELSRKIGKPWSPVNLKKGECILVPKGVLHCPKADSPATMLVFELKDTKQYGD